MRTHSDGSDPGSATAVRDAEGLMQVEVTDIGAEATRLGQPDQRVEVGSVNLNLTPGVMHPGAHLGHSSLVDAARGRVGDHDGGQRRTVDGDFYPEVVEVDIALVVTVDDHHAHPGHHRRGGIGGVCAGGIRQMVRPVCPQLWW